MRVVFDTNVLISATQWDGSVAQKLLFKLINTDVKIFSSAEILSEYQRVLKRDFDYTDEELIKIMEKILSFITLVKPIERINIVKNDPDDNKIIECAIASFSNYIISYDPDLLDLKEFRNIKIIKPEEARNVLWYAMEH